MKIKVVCSGAIDVSDVAADGTLELKERARVWEVVKRSSVDWKMRFLLPVWVNGDIAKKTQLLKEGDVVTLALPMYGG